MTKIIVWVNSPASWEHGDENRVDIEDASSVWRVRLAQFASDMLCVILAHRRLITDTTRQ